MNGNCMHSVTGHLKGEQQQVTGNRKQKNPTDVIQEEIPKN